MVSKHIGYHAGAAGGDIPKIVTERKLRQIVCKVLTEILAAVGMSASVGVGNGAAKSSQPHRD